MTNGASETIEKTLLGTSTAAEAEVTTGRLVVCSGLDDFDDEGRVTAPGDLARQIEKTFENAAVVLREGSATLDDIVLMRAYVVEGVDKQATLEAMTAALGEPLPRVEFFDVPTLSEQDMLIEVEITAFVAN